MGMFVFAKFCDDSKFTALSLRPRSSMSVFADFFFLNLPSVLTLPAFFLHFYPILTCKSINKIKVFDQLKEMEIGLILVLKLYKFNSYSWTLSYSKYLLGD